MIKTSPLSSLRGEKKKQIFRRVNEVYANSGISDVRRLMEIVRDEYYPVGGIPEHLKEPYLYVINKVVKGKQ